MTLSTLIDAGRGLREGRITSIELTEAAITAADKHDRELGVYLTRLDEAARHAARRADAELAAGLDRGPLHGIPIGVKDSFTVTGVHATAQSRVPIPDWNPCQEADVVSRLRDAGAVLTGTTTMTEFACGLPDPESPFPLPRNPWNTERSAGISSAGSASGVAAGMFLGSLGGDSAGSIRIPAAFCGITGLVPTYGRIPGEGVVPLGPSLDRIGPMARSAADCAALFTVLSGVDVPLDRPCGLRIGVTREHHFPPESDPLLESAFDGALAVLVELGAELVPVRLPHWAELTEATFTVIDIEAYTTHRNSLREHRDEYGTACRDLLTRGGPRSGADYVLAQRMAETGKRALAELFTEVDVIACPTVATGAFRFTDFTGYNERLFRTLYTPYWNTLGNPLLAMPMGFGVGGLPLSLQLAGPRLGEERILRVGAAFQQHTDWHLCTPEALR
ncbi:amidase [Pseudonocardiaceae bacterium YIM PH 21723]|nr:amidase [Pseudonocardiaceae bacterium YIM PH 21723]